MYNVNIEAVKGRLGLWLGAGKWVHRIKLS
jgi:hypothetical protein